MNEYNKPSVVEIYDSWYSGVIPEAENHVMSRILASYCDGAVVLDLGAGTGLVNEITIPSTYIAVDGSDQMLTKVTQKDNTAFTVCADLTKADDWDYVAQTVKYLGSIDVVTALWAGHIFGNIESYRSIFNILPSGGTVMFHGNLPRRRFRNPSPTSAPNEDWNKSFTAASMSAGLLEAGFEDVEVIGCNLIPDKIAKRMSVKYLSRLIYLTKVIPARYHYHAIAIGRKP